MEKNSKKLANKVAVVTGAASGIGRAIAKLFSLEGAEVIVADIDSRGGQETAQSIHADGGKAFFIETDVTRKTDVEAMVAATLRFCRGIDILVNNAGAVIYGTILETEEEDWDRLIAVNLKSVYLVSKMVVPKMIPRGGGVIVNLASTAGLVGAPAFAAYNASKGGVVLLTKNMAIDLAVYNIRVNALCPGMTLTPMAQDIFLNRAGGDADKLDGVAENGLKGYPLGRYGRPEEMAQAALFLASPDCSFMTGSLLVVDGGYTAK